MSSKATLLNHVQRLIREPVEEKPLKILVVVAEASPYASVAGLSRTAPYIARALNALGHDARLFMPKFGLIDEDQYKLQMVLEGLKVPTGQGIEPTHLICNVKQHTAADGAVTYFLENKEYYEKRANVYGYSDDQIRWALLSKGCLEFIQAFGWKPDVIHANDWHTGLVANYMRTTYAKDDLIQKIAAIFTIHNLWFQGMFDHHTVSEMDFDDGRSQIAPFFSERLAKQNFMRRGIIYAETISTVSETYAREITTPSYGEGLDKLLSELRGKLFGIVNGIDYEELNPATDKLIKHDYDANSLDRRQLNKKELQREFGLPEREDVFIVGVVSRLVEQKGIDLIAEVIWPFLKDFNAQLVVVGGGDGKYIGMFQQLQKDFPDKVGCHLMLNYTLPRAVFAGADVILVPSKFEPCGVVQMEAMRYGCVPIVRKTGGLADTVENFDSAKDEGTGFTFNEYDRWAFFAQLVRAYEVYQNKPIWQKLVARAMRSDFSWEHAAKEYVDLYKKALFFLNQRLSVKGPILPQGVYGFT